MSTDLVELGFCVKPHGIKGEFAFHLYNKDDSVLHKGSVITIFPKDRSSSVASEGQSIKIASIRFGNKVIARLDGVENRNSVEDLIPFTINISRDEFPDLDDDEFYIMDLIGVDVYDHRSGEKIGIIKKIYDNGMQDIFVVATYDHGAVEVLNIPPFVQLVDLDNNRVEVTLPEVISERN